MIDQAAATVLNTHLSWLVFAVACGIAGTGIGFYCGRLSMRQTATDMLQLALERAARDIRLFRENRVGGVPHAAAYLLLVEAEYMTAWRAQGDNHLVKPSGASRMRPPDVPRSRHAARQAQRNQIRFAGINGQRGSEDTGSVDTRTRMNRRYE